MINNNISTKDLTYISLIKLASLSTVNIFSDDDTVELINELPPYANRLKRVLPLLKARADKLNVFNQLNISVQRLLINEVKLSVVTELARKQQLNRIISLFSSEGIPLILLKGVAFNGLIYNSDAPRTSNDIDILVKENDWNQAKVLLATFMQKQPIIKSQTFDDLYESSFIPIGNFGANVDIHKSLIHPLIFTINEDKLWSESKIHPKYNCQNVRMLSPEQSIVHQALHAYKDLDFCKYNLVDTSEIITLLKPDINICINTAKNWGATIPLYCLLLNVSSIAVGKVKQKEFSHIQPSKLRLFFLSKVLELHENTRLKSFQYRINQLASLVVFSTEQRRTMKFIFLYIQLSVSNYFKRLKT